MKNICGEARYFQYLLLVLSASDALLLVMGDLAPIFSRALVFAVSLIAVLYLLYLYIRYRVYLSVLGRIFPAVYMLVLFVSISFYVPLIFYTAGRVKFVTAYGATAIATFTPLMLASILLARRFLRVYSANGRRLVYPILAAMPTIFLNILLGAVCRESLIKVIFLLLAVLYGVSIFSLSIIPLLLKGGAVKRLYTLLSIFVVVYTFISSLHVYIHCSLNLCLDTLFMAVVAAASVILYGLVYVSLCRIVLTAGIRGAGEIRG